MVDAQVRVRVLGVTHIVRDDRVVPFTAAKQRRLLATLALHLGRPVAVHDLITALWDDPPAAAHATLQGYIADLRRLLEPDRDPRGAARLLRTEGAAYVLDLPRSAVDVTAFADSVRSAVTASRVIPDCLRPTVTGNPAELEQALADLEAALDNWAHPFADLGDLPEAVAERHRLDETRTMAREHAALYRLALGRHEAALVDLEPLADQHPLREHVWALLAVALYRADRQADALLALTGLRHRLSEELGVDPAPSTRALYDAILRQDSTLAPADRQPVMRRADVVTTLVGRDADLARLLALLDDVRAGRGGRVAGIVGEPGIGKTRLARAVEEAAAQLGFVVARAAAIEDDGAPPLWPLRQALASLAKRTSTPAQLDATPGTKTREGGSFQVRERMRELLVAAGRSAPVLLVLEDVHWADFATLKALRHLVDRVETMPVLVLLTRCPGSFEAITRSGLPSAVARSGIRIELDGLSASAVREVVRETTGVDLDASTAELLTRRTGGNPFFASVLARFGDPAGDALPGELLDVIEHRLSGLPEETLATLRAAALLGGEFDSAMLGQVAGVEPTAALDRLGDAMAAGVVVERGGDALDFVHPLVREALLAITPANTRARLHARIARALETRSQTSGVTRTRAAQHWRLAGPAFADQAWVATGHAADAAHAVFAHDEEAELLAQAIASQRLDPSATAEARFDLLERQGLALRWAGRPESAALAQEEALAVAELADDRELMLRAVRARGEGVLWDATRYAMPNGSYHGALSRLLRRLGEEESALRALTLAALACEAYYVAPPEWIDGWSADALALALRLGDEGLIRDIQGRSLGARWRPDTAVERHALATTMAFDARSTHDIRFRALASCWELILETELGHLDVAGSLYAPVRQLVTENHLSSLLPPLDLYESSWAALAGDQERAHLALTRVHEHARSANSPHLTTAATAAGGMNAALAGDSEAVLATYGSLGRLRGEVPGHTAAAGLLLRVGEVDRARETFSAHGADIGQPIYVGLFNTAMAAELALAFDDRDMAGRAYDYLLAYAGRPASAGSTAYLGPVDAFLALAAQAMGRSDEAAAHADAALNLCAVWGIPAVATWLLGWRDRAGF